MLTRVALLAAYTKALAHGALGWTWAISLTAMILCSLPWVEFANSNYIAPTLATAALLTLTGWGPAYFAARTTSGRVRQLLSYIKPKTWGFVWVSGALLILLTVLLFCLMGGYAVLPLRDLAIMLDPDRGGFRTQLVLFRRGDASIQVRYRPFEGADAMVIRPLTPWFNVRTGLASNQPDTTWEPAYPAVLAPDYVQREIMDGQLSLLRRLGSSQPRVDALIAKQKIHLVKTRTARGFNTLRFMVDADLDSLDGVHRVSLVRPLAIDADSSWSGAQLRSDGALYIYVWLKKGHSDSEKFVLALPGFKGPGRYTLNAPPPDFRILDSGLGSGYVEFAYFKSIYNSAAYFSTPNAPVYLAITRHDSVRHLIAGRFEGALLTDDGKRLSLKDGSFEMSYAWPPAPTTTSLHAGSR